MRPNDITNKVSVDTGKKILQHEDTGEEEERWTKEEEDDGYSHLSEICSLKLNMIVKMLREEGLRN